MDETLKRAALETLAEKSNYLSHKQPTGQPTALEQEVACRFQNVFFLL